MYQVQCSPSARVHARCITLHANCDPSSPHQRTMFAPIEQYLRANATDLLVGTPRSALLDRPR